MKINVYWLQSLVRMFVALFFFLPNFFLWQWQRDSYYPGDDLFLVSLSPVSFFFPIYADLTMLFMYFLQSSVFLAEHSV